MGIMGITLLGALRSAVIALALDAVLIAGIIIWRFIQVSDSFSITDLGPFCTIAGLIAALVIFICNLQRARSEDILKAATDLLEKAYTKLEPQDGSNLPSNNRLSWNSSARLVLTAEKLAKEITEPSHQLIYQEKKEYWRAQFYELICPSLEGLPGSFYAKNAKDMISHNPKGRAPLSQKSLAFLYRFVRWPKENTDPLGEQSNFTAEEIENMESFGPRGLGKLLADVRKEKEKELILSKSQDKETKGEGCDL
jgi:hypothetical protein